MNRADTPKDQTPKGWTGPAVSAVIGGRYRLAKRIGRGGMADVWAAHDGVLDRSVAIKLFRFDTQPMNNQRIQAEIQTLARLHHPGIVTVFDAGAEPDRGTEGLAFPYIVMELVEGGTLADRLADGPLRVEDTATLARRLATTLAYVHGQGVVHRDIKPANILIPRAPSTEDAAGADAKLTDFGIARLVDSTRFTASGFTLGTANYLAPEQATGTDAGPPADIYALGLVLIECLTGAIAFPGAGIEAALARLHRQPEVPADLPEPWPRLLAAMTASDPAQRPTATAIAESIVAGSPTMPLPERGPDSVTTAMNVQDPPNATRPYDAAPARSLTDPAAETERHRRAPVHRHLGLLLAAAAVIAALIVIAALNSNGPGHPSPSPSVTTPATVPSYPEVSGSLGDKLKQLQDAVG